MASKIVSSLVPSSLTMGTAELTASDTSSRLTGVGKGEASADDESRTKPKRPVKYRIIGNGYVIG
jgi:hypothetical protein